MAEVTMPRLSDTMTEGTIARWVKQQGEQVQKGDILAEIETDKATMELEAYEGGVVEQVLVSEGQTVAIGQPIALIGGGAAAPAPEPASAAPANDAATNDPSPDQATAADDTTREPAGDSEPRSAATTGAVAPGDETRAAEPTVGQGTAQPERASDVETVQRDPDDAEPSDGQDVAAPGYGTGDGAVRPSAGTSQARSETPDDEDGVRASPMARRIALERGIDLHTIPGSGPGGRVIRADVEAAPAAQADGAAAPTTAPAAPSKPTAPAPAPTPAPPATAAVPDADAEEIPLSNIRRVTGRRMVESIQSAPHFFLTSVVDVTDLVDLRAQINQRLESAGDDTKVSLNDLIVKSCAVALRSAPDVNVSFVDGKLYRKKRVHIGVAVAIENGLLVPVIRDADQKSVGQIAREAKALIGKARGGKLAPADYTGGTFTVSNLGMFGVEHFTAVINTPEAAILAVGASAAEPVVVDGKVEVRERMRVTLSVDHRALDGASGARFLQVLKGILESPMRILI